MTTRRYVLVGLGVMSLFGMSAALRTTFQSIDLGIDRIAKIPLLTSLGFCVVFRVVNAFGWSLSVRALGQRIGGLAAIRIWLLSESCRWIPGSVWSFGSRAVLAVGHGVTPAIAGASVVLETLLSVAGWFVVALSGWYVLPGLFDVVRITPGMILATGLLGLLALIALPVGWTWVKRDSRGRALLASFRGRAAMLARVRPNRFALMVALAYSTLMALLNGLVFVAMLVAMPGGGGCPIAAAVAANAVAWLAGFFAIFAPAGLVVREGCLAALLTAWIPLPQAVVIALVWRAVQVVSEICCATGLYVHAVLTAGAVAATEPAQAAVDADRRTLPTA
jgi:hypothetical protein